VAFSQRLAMAIVDAPAVVLPLLHEAARDTVLEDFPDFGTIHADVFVRFPELAYVEPIRNLRCCPMGGIGVPD
jgi:DNA replicative helicase MCM subunit Mcm2 (Cdc46/Mcm family)